jgi:adenylate cyclase, class 2
MTGELETEAKFPVSDLRVVHDRLVHAGAKQLSDRHLERNWRFDDSDRTLSQSGKVLRIRQGPVSSLTFKAPTEQVLTRREIEFALPEAEVGVRLLEALGYHVIAMYEKYRRVLALEDCHIMLDELPFGQFVEIEGPTPARLEHIAAGLGLGWPAHLSESYLELGHQVASSAGYDPAQITFQAFGSLTQNAITVLGLSDALTDPADAG